MTAKEMREIARAKEIAQEEAVDRHVMILFPTSEWRSVALPQSENIWLRASTNESSLKSVPIDTLILVDRKHPDWNKKGELYARELLRTSRRPRIIHVRGCK